MNPNAGATVRTVPLAPHHQDLRACAERGPRLVATLGDDITGFVTLSQSSPEYAQTRAFYQAMGFHRLIVLPDHWGPENPCLLLVHPL